MNKRIFIFILSIILMLNVGVYKNVYGEEKKETITVGVFDLEPFAYINSYGEISGYYIDLFNFIAKKMNVEVKYVLSDLKEWSSNLENGQVDIILGSSITEERLEKYSFNKYSLISERFAIYTNKDINSISFKNSSTFRIGGIKESSKPQWVFNLFKSLNIEYIPVLVSNYSELKELMDSDQIDLMVYSDNSFSKYKKIYKFIGDKTYVASKKIMKLY